MAITYHAGRRIQGNETTVPVVATSSTGSTGNATNNGSGFTATTGLFGAGMSQASGNYKMTNEPVLGNSWSFNFWCIPQAASGNDYFMQMDSDSGTTTSAFYMYNHSSLGLNMSVYDSTGVALATDSSNNAMWLAMTNGSWNMITIVWDNTAKQLRTYKNGALYGTSKTWTHTNAGNMGVSNRVWYMLNYNSETGATYASRATNLDEWSWWTGTLSQADITELYNGGSGIKASELSSANKLNLIVYYDFNDSPNGTLTNQAPVTISVTNQDTKPTNLATAFEDNFSTNQWDDLGGNVRVVNGGLHMDGRRNANEGAVYDLGAGNVSDTKWVLRCKYKVTRASAEVASGDIIYWGLSDSDENEIANDAQNFIGLGVVIGTGTFTYWIEDAQNQTLYTNINTSSTYFSHAPTVETIYVEIIRTGSTDYSIELFSDPSYSTSIEKVTGTCSASITGLRYIKCCGAGGSLATTAFQGDVYDAEFYNNYNSVPSNTVQVGSRYEETNTRKIYNRVIQEEWVQEGEGISGRGVFAGGLSPAYPNGSRLNSMEYITIGTLGNGIDFGDLTSAKAYLAGAGNDTRGLFAGGDNGSAINNIDQFTFMTLGNCTDFGDLTSVRTYFNGTSNNTYGVFAGGNNSKTTIDYVTIATPSNSTGYIGFTFDRTSAVGYDSPTKAFFSSGGGTNTYNNIIETVVFGTWGTVADFGDLTLGREYASGCSSTTRGIVAGGFTTANAYAPVNNIDYTTMDTPSNAIDFGDLSSPRYELDSVSNGTRGVFYSGVTTGDAHTNIIDYITIATLGNATDFGDALITRDSFAGCSNK
tara:strand:+ start:8 stop:2452 length:2445 start_codon:yes stop_codon:yes gene_type:complete